MIKYSYGSIYNSRPDEMYGMGKESLRISGKGTIEDFLKHLSCNSSIKHENDLEAALGSDEVWKRDDWTPYIGQPMFFIVDIKYEDESK